MDVRDLDIDYGTDTESSESESSLSIENGLFKETPLVLELHDIRKDDPSMPTLKSIDPVRPTIQKIKTHKKKIKGRGAKDTSQASLSTDSSEASCVAPSSTEVKEEFYDAHDSYHVMPGNQIPLALAARLLGHAETNQNPKASESTATSELLSTTSVMHNEPSHIIKPTLPPY